MKSRLPPAVAVLFLAGMFAASWPGGRNLLPWLLAAWLGVRAVREPRRSWRLLWLALAAALAGGAWWQGTAVVRWVPAVTFLLLAWLFGRTLWRPPPLIERMVRLQFAAIPPYLLAYLRRLTQVWTGFFVAAALVSAILTLLASPKVWAGFHGIGIWLATGLLVGGEYLYRRRRFPELERMPPPQETFREIVRHGKAFWLD